jgi:hypothetical protein
MPGTYGLVAGDALSEHYQSNRRQKLPSDYNAATNGAARRRTFIRARGNDAASNGSARLDILVASGGHLVFDSDNLRRAHLAEQRLVRSSMDGNQGLVWCSVREQGTIYTRNAQSRATRQTKEPKRM